MPTDTDTYPCRDCGGTGRVDAFRARVQAAAAELRDERFLSTLVAAKLSPLLDLMTDADVAYLLERDVLGNTDYATTDWDIVRQACARLRRAGGGELEPQAGSSVQQTT